MLGRCTIWYHSHEPLSPPSETTFTTLLHTLLSRPLLPPLSVPTASSKSFSPNSLLFLTPLILPSVYFLSPLSPSPLPRSAFYFRALTLWATPFLALLIFTTSSFALHPIRRKTVATSIALATAWFITVDTIALRAGSWRVESDVLVGWELWRAMPVEEATFFLVTNTLVVFGLEACEHLFAIFTLYPELVATSLSSSKMLGTDEKTSLVMQTNPYLPTSMPLAPPPLLALYVNRSNYPSQRQEDLFDAVRILEKKSRSFWVASAGFPAEVRFDLIIL